jgi:hypothetical protein
MAWMNSDPLQVFGLDSLEYRRGPLDVRSSAPERQIFEFCGLGEIKRRFPRHDYIHA